MLKIKKTSKITVVAAFATLLITLSSLYYLLRIRSNNNTGKQDSGQTAQINYSPATKSEKIETENYKQKILDDQNSNSSESPPTLDKKRTVIPVITNADIDGTRAYIPNIVEEDGICTAMYSKNNVRFSESSSGFINVSSTQCEFIVTSRLDFQEPGIWSIYISYSSSKSNGISQTQTFKVE